MIYGAEYINEMYTLAILNIDCVRGARFDDEATKINTRKAVVFQIKRSSDVSEWKL